MATRVGCRECGASILIATSERTGGLCMACKQGIRKDIEDAKRYYAQQRQYDPFRELWKSLVDRVYQSKTGYSGLTEVERLYYSLRVLEGEVYNGGFHQFFSNTSGELFQDVVGGLQKLNAPKSLELLLRAKEILFPHGKPPHGENERWKAMRQYREEDAVTRPEWDLELDRIDGAYYENPDQLDDKLRAFAEEKGLVAPFRKGPET